MRTTPVPHENRTRFPARQAGSRRPVPTLMLACLALLSAGPPAQADDGWDRASLTIREENDIGFSDRHYTQGLRLAYLSHDLDPTGAWTRLANQIPPLGLAVRAVKWGVSVGQDIYTPEDTDTPDLILDDRPYAGWLHAGLTLQRRGTSRSGRALMDLFRLTLGVTGPASLAGDAQTWWHRVIGVHQPQGWRHQIRTEPGLMLSAERRWRFVLTPETTPFAVQLVPHAGGALGNVSTHLAAGGTWRLGWYIPNEFGVRRSDARSSGRVGVWFLIGAEGRAVLHNVFLDGNLWQASHHVSKKPLVGELRLGLGVALTSKVELSAIHVYRTREFSRQRRFDEFSSVSLTAKF